MLTKKLSVVVAAAVMMVMATSPALADPPQVKGNNGNHFGDIRNDDNGNHNGAGAGGGKFNNNGNHNGQCGALCE